MIRRVHNWGKGGYGGKPWKVSLCSWSAEARAFRRAARLVILDGNAPVDAVFLRRIVSGGRVIRAAIVPDDDVALLPFVAVLAGRLHHHRAELFEDCIGLGVVEAFYAEDLPVIVVQQRAPGLGVLLDEPVAHRLLVSVFLVQEHVLRPAAAVFEEAVAAFQPLLQAGRKRVVRRVAAREQRIAAVARNRER